MLPSGAKEKGNKTVDAFADNLRQDPVETAAI
jgi:hypothetical protein